MIKDWREIWKQKWNDDKFHSDYSNIIDPEKIEQFISTILTQHQEEMVEKIDDFRQSVRNEPVSSNFDIAFDEFLKTLKSNKE